jgi:predicted nuclease of predicted toxin-antitoxin system
MKIVVDMNLSPDWVPVLVTAGHDAVHWSSLGSPSAPDREIMNWARENGYVVFTHDLDFGAILAATNANCPSVIQVRTPDPTPQHCSAVINKALGIYLHELMSGALITIDENRSRIRLLPLQ